jgi:hypothetical protein
MNPIITNPKLNLKDPDGPEEILSILEESIISSKEELTTSLIESDIEQELIKEIKKEKMQEEVIMLREELKQKIKNLMELQGSGGLSLHHSYSSEHSHSYVSENEEDSMEEKEKEVVPNVPEWLT